MNSKTDVSHPGHLSTSQLRNVKFEPSALRGYAVSGFTLGGVMAKLWDPDVISTSEASPAIEPCARLLCLSPASTTCLLTSFPEK